MPFAGVSTEEALWPPTHGFCLTYYRFEAINVAMGNTRSSPYSYCVDAHAGIDADIISWEMVRDHGLVEDRVK